MLIPFKHDSANGELGASDAFTPGERSAAEAFRRQVLVDRGYVPEGLGSVPAFESLLAAFYLDPERRIAGLMWIYRDLEGLRRSLFFTVFRLPLDSADPYTLAASIENSVIDRGRIQEAVAARRFEIEIEDRLAGGGVEVDPAGFSEVPLRELPLIHGAELRAASGRAFLPFITVRPPAVDEGKDVAAKAAHSAKPQRRQHEVVTAAAEGPSWKRTETGLRATDEARSWKGISLLLTGLVLGGLLVGGVGRIWRQPSDREAKRSAVQREIQREIQDIRAEVRGLREENTKLRQEAATLREQAAARAGEGAPEPAGPSYVVDADEWWLRTAPRKGSDTEGGLLRRGTIVQIIGMKGDWAQVSLNGYMHKDGLRRSP
jgi:cell division protein FtsB